MTDTIFCYSCRAHHPAVQMCLVPTRRGRRWRWRCLRSIAEANRSRSERDAFGELQTAIKREQARTHACYSLRLRAQPSAD
jgi:hypothetical protein